VDAWQSQKGSWAIEFADGLLLLGETLTTIGNDRFIAGATDPGVTFEGGEGNDLLTGTLNDDYLYGGADNDRFTARAGNDTIVGGRGNDLLADLSQSLGDDTYLWNWGDQEDYVADSGGANILRLGDGILMEHLTFERISVDASTYLTNILHFKAGADLRIVITHPTISGLSGAVVVERWSTGNSSWTIQFSDGSVLPGNTIATLGNDRLTIVDSTLFGDAGDDTLIGSDSDDQIFGGADHDSLIGNDGDDELNGGAGNDILNGGAGNDVFHWNLGDGNDYIVVDAHSTNIIRFGPGVTPADLIYVRLDANAANYLSQNPTEDGDELQIVISGSADPNLDGSIVMDRFNLSAINAWRLEFTEIDPLTGESYEDINREQIISNILPWDADFDGLPDYFELENGLPIDSSNAKTDADEDGLVDLDEYLYGTLVREVDSDGDGATDGDEVHTFSTDPTIFNSEYTIGDQDHDGIIDTLEIANGWDPTNADSNGNGILDGVEVNLGLDPTALDPDGDGLDTAAELLLGTSPIHADTDGDGVNDNIDINPLDPSLNALSADTTAPDAPVIRLYVPTTAVAQ